MSDISSINGRSLYEFASQRTTRFAETQRTTRTFDAEILGAARKVQRQPDSAQITNPAKAQEASAVQTLAEPDPNRVIESKQYKIETEATATATVAATQQQAPITKVRPGVVEAAERPPVDTIGGFTQQKLDAIAASQSNEKAEAAPAQGRFTIDDLTATLDAYGSSEGDENFDATRDLDGNGTVDIEDLLSVLRNFDSSQRLTDPSGYTGDDLNEVLERFGSARGDEGYDEKFDVDSDGVIGIEDMLKVLRGFEQASDFDRLVNAYGSSSRDSGYLAEFDYDEDGTIGIEDLLHFLRADSTA